MGSHYRLDNLTIIIPTYNRNYYLSRLLYYLKKNSIKNIIVADSSEPQKHETNKEIVRTLFGDSIAYIWAPGNEISNIYGKIISALEMVETPYATLCGDKDFPIFPGVEMCLKYLDNNPDYQVADGRYYSFQPDYSKKEIDWKKVYIKKESIYSPHPLLRLKKLITKYQPLSYSIHRTETLHESMSQTVKYTDDVRFGELYSGMFPLVFGKYAHLDIDYWCREKNSSHSTSCNLPRLDDYMKAGLYDEKYMLFKEGLCANLPDSVEEIASVIDPAMHAYLLKSFPHSFDKQSIDFATVRRLLLKYLSNDQKRFLEKYYQKFIRTSTNHRIRNTDMSPELNEITRYLQYVLEYKVYIDDLPIRYVDLSEPSMELKELS